MKTNKIRLLCVALFGLIVSTAIALELTAPQAETLEGRFRYLQYNSGMTASLIGTGPVTDAYSYFKGRESAFAQAADFFVNTGAVTPAQAEELRLLSRSSEEVAR